MNSNTNSSNTSNNNNNNNTTRGCACGATGLAPTAIYCDNCLRSMGLYDNYSSEYKNVPSIAVSLSSSSSVASAMTSKSTTAAAATAAGTVVPVPRAPPAQVTVSTLTSRQQRRGYINSDYASDALFALPYHCCWDHHRQRLLICDSANHRVRIINQDGNVLDLEAYNTPERRSYPCGVAVDRVGNIYITESHCILRISNNDTDVTIIAGSDRPGFIDGDGVTTARFNDPRAIAVDQEGTEIYVADYFNKALRRYHVATGQVSTLSQGGWPGQMFNHHTPEPRSFDYPAGVTVDRVGNILVADGPGLWVVSHGHVAAVAVHNESASLAHTIGRLAAVVSHPSLGGDIFVADNTFHCVRRIKLDSAARIDAMLTVAALATFPPGIIPLIASYFPVKGDATVLAGNTGPGLVDGPALDARFNTPRGLALDHMTRTIYVTDTSNHTIRTISY